MGNRAGAFCYGSAALCPKASLHPSGDHELLDDVNTCDPAGAVFHETLEDLNEVDRLLLTFSSSANLAVLRWLFVLGGNVDACDTNGTTCLHAACRSGSLSVVSDLIGRDLPLDATDVTGWTALHVALFMGRRNVALVLMQNGADLTAKNMKGLAPSDLSSDAWLREALAACALHRRSHGPDSQWRYAKAHEVIDDSQLASHLRFEPFFVPRAPVMNDYVGSASVVNLGVEIFNQRPGHGLAFLVATGCVRDFPVELSSFLAENPVSPAQVGEFLGENFSLSQTLRLEYINSVRLLGTGVVSCLAKVFKQFSIPSDLQKIDRLIDGIAQIWWRQHEQEKEKDGESPSYAAETLGDNGGEVEGYRLMKHLTGYDGLHQLMMSAVLLHWNLYSPLPPSQRVTPAQWLDMNRGFEAADGAGVTTMKHIQCLIYNTITHSFFPQLQIWANRPPCSGPVSGSLAAPPRDKAGAAEGSESEGAIDGWGMLVGGGLPSLAGSSGTVTYRHIRNILSEQSLAHHLASPATSRSSRPGYEPSFDAGERAAGFFPGSVACRHPGLHQGARHGSGGVIEGKVVGRLSSNNDRVWLSIRHGLLFLAPKPHNWAPYAFVHLGNVVLHTVDPVSLTVILAAKRSPLESNSPETGNMAESPSAGLRGSATLGDSLDLDGPQLQLVFLLPDGRWQVLDVPHFQVQFTDARQLETWNQAFAVHCSSRAADPQSRSPSPTSLREGTGKSHRDI